MDAILKQSLIIIPAFNEEAALPSLLAEIRQAAPGLSLIHI